MGSKIGFEMSFSVSACYCIPQCVRLIAGDWCLDHCRGNTWMICEFHDSSGNGFGDIWWTDNPIYFSSNLL